MEIKIKYKNGISSTLIQENGANLSLNWDNPSLKTLFHKNLSNSRYISHGQMRRPSILGLTKSCKIIKVTNGELLMQIFFNGILGPKMMTAVPNLVSPRVWWKLSTVKGNGSISQTSPVTDGLRRSFQLTKKSNNVLIKRYSRTSRGQDSFANVGLCRSVLRGGEERK